MTKEENDKRKEEEPKQVIVVNKRLNMPMGKLGAQVAHASLGAFFTFAKMNGKKFEIDMTDLPAVQQWVEHRFTKIVLYVKSEEKLIEIYNKAQEKGLASVLIKDAGFTYFDKPTHTCVGIGPVYPEDLIGVTDKLRVL